MVGKYIGVTVTIAEGTNHNAAEKSAIIASKVTDTLVSITKQPENSTNKTHQKDAF